MVTIRMNVSDEARPATERLLGIFSYAALVSQQREALVDDDFQPAEPSIPSLDYFGETAY